MIYSENERGRKEKEIIRRIIFLIAVVSFIGVNAWMPWLASLAGQGRSIPDGPGKEATQKICANCHELEKSFSIKQDREGWQRTVNKMVALGAKGSDDDLNAVVEYLVKNFPADEVPKVNVNKAEAIDLESGLSLRRSQAAAIIQYRKKNGDFKSIEDLKKVPGIDIEKIEAKKDRIAF
jgi:competence protein ComEA